MALRTKQQTERPRLLRALTSWSTDTPDGQPIAILEDERFAEDSWGAERFRGWLCDADLPDPDVKALKAKVKHGTPGGHEPS